MQYAYFYIQLILQIENKLEVSALQLQISKWFKEQIYCISPICKLMFSSQRDIKITMTHFFHFASPPSIQTTAIFLPELVPSSTYLPTPNCFTIKEKYDSLLCD